VLDALKAYENGLGAQTLIETIEWLEENIKYIEKVLRELTVGDRVVELLMSIPGCGEICAWTIRAYTDDIDRFATPKKYASFAGLAPWVQNSNEVIRHGSITKRGPKELRTALVQVVMGWRRLKKKTDSWRLMRRYVVMKKSKGSGKAIIATARKIAMIIWNMLTDDVEFDLGQMVDKKGTKKSERMGGVKSMAHKALNEKKENSEETTGDKKKRDGVRNNATKTGVAREKKKKGG